MVCADGAFLCNKNLQSKVFAGTYRLPAQTHIDHGKAYLGVSSYSGSPLTISFAPVSRALYRMPRINLSFCLFPCRFVRHFDNRIKLNRIELNCFASFWKDTFCAAPGPCACSARFCAATCKGHDNLQIPIPPMVPFRLGPFQSVEGNAKLNFNHFQS